MPEALIVPLLAVLIPIVRFAPMLYYWRVRSRIYRWYGELKLLELNIQNQFDPDLANEYSEKLDDLELRAYTRALPAPFTGEVYTLRQHIDLVRRSLLDGARPE